MGGVLRALEEAGIETMPLKGTALLLGNYESYGLRLMTDCDILVPTKQIPKAFDVISAWDAGRLIITAKG